MLKKILLGLLAVVVLIQIIPVDRTNPPVTLNVPASGEVQQILKRSCYDCHSNETTWPWYSYVAPVSWLVAHDVNEGREHLNFSEWDRYTPDKRRHKAEEVIEEVDKGKMPLDKYLWLHSDASVDASELQTLRQWAQGSEVTTGTTRPGVQDSEEEHDEEHEHDD